jgi:AcrR family transcriptional regulator
MPARRSPGASGRLTRGTETMPSLRERKKADTREAIRSAAVELFCTQGFAATTMDAVAEEANVSVRTVFRYFATKEDLVFADVEEDLVDFRDLLDARPADEPVMASVRAVVEVLADRMESGQDDDARMAPLLHGEPALRQRYLGVLDRVEETVADWARVRLDAGAGDLRPGLLAAGIVSVQRVVVDAVLEGDPRPLADLIREAVGVIGRGFDQLDS